MTSAGLEGNDVQQSASPMPSHKHPAGLTVLSFVILFEAFGYYVVSFLLAVYLTTVAGLPDNQADLVFGAFTSLLFLTMIVGGYIADHMAGFRRAIVAGLIISALSLALLAIGRPLYIALAGLIVGQGLSKVNITSLLGTLYSDNAQLRDSGYTVFYMGLNVGSFSAGIGAGYAAQQWGYSVAFALASLGQLAALAVFLAGRKHLQGQGVKPNSLNRLFTSLPQRSLLAIGLAALVVGIWGLSLLLRFSGYAGVMVASVTVLAIAMLVIELRRESIEVRRRLAFLLMLFLFAIVFWAIYGQSSLSVALFIERDVDRTVFDREVATSTFLSLNPILIVATAPLFTLLWLRLARARIKPRVAIKFAAGIALLGSGFLVLVFGIWTTDPNAKVAAAWVVAFFVLLSLGEMCVSPVGLSLVSRLAPARLLGITMGMWFLAEAIANFLSGNLAEFAAIPADTVLAASETIYRSAFASYGFIGLIAAIALLLTMRLSHRLTSGKTVLD